VRHRPLPLKQGTDVSRFGVVTLAGRDIRGDRHHARSPSCGTRNITRAGAIGPRASKIRVQHAGIVNALHSAEAAPPSSKCLFRSPTFRFPFSKPHPAASTAHCSLSRGATPRIRCLNDPAQPRAANSATARIPDTPKKPNLSDKRWTRIRRCCSTNPANLLVRASCPHPCPRTRCACQI
jgi:hypothetical protein